MLPQQYSIRALGTSMPVHHRTMTLTTGAANNTMTAATNTDSTYKIQPVGYHIFDGLQRRQRHD